MNNVTGIKSVDFKITAKGHGVVNWNGPTNLALENGKTVDNHTLPKLRGYTNLSDKVNDTGYKYRKEPTDIDFKKTRLYISQNCARHHLFRDHTFDIHYVNTSNVVKVLASITGLVRGYAVPATQEKRASPLLLEDFVDHLGNGNFEQYGQAGPRDSSSFFSKTTFGDTKYKSYGSISVEQLQFISLDKKFDRAAMVIKEGEGEVVAQTVQEFIQSLDENSSPIVTYHHNYVRNGAIFTEGEHGLMLNNDAIMVVINHTLEMLAGLTIRQAKAYMYVDSILTDYNDSNKMMRIKRYESEISEQPETDFAVYFSGK